MDAEFDYDTTNLQALREELKLLNTAALEDGLISMRDGWPVTPRARRAAAVVRTAKARATPATTPATSKTSSKSKAKGPSPETGKAGARRLLTIARRGEGDGSPAVAGTDFTEAGIVRLLAHLRKRRSKGFRFLHRLHQFLIRPVQPGIRTSAGISVERLQLVARQLLEIEAHGWHQFRARVERRGKRAPAADRTAKPARRAKAKPVAKSTRKAKSTPKKATPKPAKAR